MVNGILTCTLSTLNAINLKPLIRLTIRSYLFIPQLAEKRSTVSYKQSAFSCRHDAFDSAFKKQKHILSCSKILSNNFQKPVERFLP